MPRSPAPVKGVFQREDDPTGNWYARFRIDEKLVKKSFGTDRAAAIEYVEKARTLRRVGEGHVPKSAKGVPKIAKELEAVAVGSSVLVEELCDDLLRHIQSRPNVYKDQRNPPYRIGLIKKHFGHCPAASVRPYEIADWLDTLGRAPATVNRYKVTFSSIYRYGKQRDKVQVNPAHEVSQLKLNNGVIRYLKPEEEKRLRAVLQRAVDEWDPETRSAGSVSCTESTSSISRSERGCARESSTVFAGEISISPVVRSRCETRRTAQAGLFR